MGDPKELAIEAAAKALDKVLPTGEKELMPYAEVALDAAHAGGHILYRHEYQELIDALSFYADPDIYFAIGFFPDPPTGDFMNDFSEHGLRDYPEGDQRPGKRAREALAGKEGYADWVMDLAEECDALEEQLEKTYLAYIEASNPGIDIEEVRQQRLKERRGY